MTDIFIDAVSVFPDRIKTPLILAGKNSPRIYEIRLVASASVYFYTSEGIYFVSSAGELKRGFSDEIIRPSKEELEETVNRAMGYSGFLYAKEIKEGFITYSHGCRMGICTSGGGESFALGTVNSLALRLPFSGSYEKDGESQKRTQKLLELCKNGLLIAGAPASGKTTLLRILTKALSDGKNGEYKKVTVIDERGEISLGTTLGVCTDIIKGKAKSEAILHALRLLSPHYIVCDELGAVSESKALLEGLNSGVSFIASIHAASLNELIMRSQFRLLFNENVFSAVVFLSAERPGEIIKIYSRKELENEIGGSFCNKRIGYSDVLLSDEFA